MKNKKLKLNELKVQSFVTSMNGTAKVTVQGGEPSTFCVNSADMTGGYCLAGCGNGANKEIGVDNKSNLIFGDLTQACTGGVLCII